MTAIDYRLDPLHSPSNLHVFHRSQEMRRENVAPGATASWRNNLVEEIERDKPCQALDEEGVLCLVSVNQMTCF